MDVPQVLADTADAWDRSGRPSQVPSRWSPNLWASALPAFKPLFLELGDRPLARTDGVAWAARITDPPTAVRAFVVAMIWGYGPVGYGPFRTRQVMSATPDFPDAIYQWAQIAQSEGGVAAYRQVADARRANRAYFKHLGPAFGTKFLYFVTKAWTDSPTPIMDALVQRWFSEHAHGTPLVLQWSSPRSYARLVETLAEWADQLSSAGRTMSVDDVEYLIFAQQATQQGSPQWSEVWTEAPTRRLPSVILRELENAFAARGAEDRVLPLLEPLYAVAAALEQHAGTPQ